MTKQATTDTARYGATCPFAATIRRPYHTASFAHPPESVSWAAGIEPRVTLPLWPVSVGLLACIERGADLIHAAREQRPRHPGSAVTRVPDQVMDQGSGQIGTGGSQPVEMDCKHLECFGIVGNQHGLGARPLADAGRSYLAEVMVECRDTATSHSARDRPSNQGTWMAHSNECVSSPPGLAW